MIFYSVTIKDKFCSGRGVRRDFLFGGNTVTQERGVLHTGNRDIRIPVAYGCFCGNRGIPQSRSANPLRTWVVLRTRRYGGRGVRLWGQYRSVGMCNPWLQVPSGEMPQGLPWYDLFFRLCGASVRGMSGKPPCTLLSNTFWIHPQYR